PERMASRILGMGDMLTLIERAQSTFDEENSKKLSARLKENSFDLTDLMEQMKQIQKMGPLKQIIGMLPGVGDKIKDADIDDSQLKRIEAIILSMTPAERAKPSIIDPKRKRRIAAGSGNSVADVNRLLRQFEEMQKMMKQFGVMGKNGKGRKNKLRMPPMGGMPPLM
ncbi:MAG: signal recognition particle protein, partial [Muribaculaceae bacterium]|nr:signal recognition particle protein [Muribaculaceae bacterium]